MNYLKVFNSPFVFPQLKLYIGKIDKGVPYFLPRKLVKVKGEKYLKFKFIKYFGFNKCGLGWKTKWEGTDYRFECHPMFSLVLFGIQFHLTIYNEHPDSYWTSWLYYSRNTDKNKSTLERLEQCIKEFPQTYQTYRKGKDTGKINYYNYIIKNKWKKKLKNIDL